MSINRLHLLLVSYLLTFSGWMSSVHKQTASLPFLIVTEKSYAKYGEKKAPDYDRAGKRF